MNTNSKIKLNMDALKTSKEWVRHKVKSGNNVYRILPPFGEASNGFPYRKWQIIWGLQDPESGRSRPYASPMMTEKRCPVMEFVDELRERLTKMEGDLKARGLSDDALRKHEKYARLAQFVRDMTPKTTYIYNAVDKSGVVGLLELKATAHKDMKAKMNEYIKDYNQDPTSLNSEDDDSGVWFNVIRTGEGFKTEYKVEKVQTKQKVGATVSFVDDRSPLPENLVQNFDNMAYDLSSVYRSTTYDEVNEILQANLDRFYKACPEADMSADVDLDSDDAAPAAPVAKPSPAKAGPVGTGKVPLLKDEDDEEPVARPAKSTGRSVPMPVADDDDFMAQADAILKG
jgi:hypothetical protein